MQRQPQPLQLAGQNQPKRQILETAREKALEAESREEGSASFDLARLAAALRDEAACKGWLAKAQRLQAPCPRSALCWRIRSLLLTARSRGSANLPAFESLANPLQIRARPDEIRL